MEISITAEAIERENEMIERGWYLFRFVRGSGVGSTTRATQRKTNEMSKVLKLLEPDNTPHGDYGMTPARLVGLMSRLRDVHPDMTINQAMAFFFVAANPGITQRGLYEKVGLTDSTASRILAVLSDFGSRKTEGLGLIRADINAEDRRERLLSLTKRGKRLMEDVCRDLERKE